MAMLANLLVISRIHDCICFFATKHYFFLALAGRSVHDKNFCKVFAMQLFILLLVVVVILNLLANIPKTLIQLASINEIR
jgi:hypothetical protein